MIGRTRYHFDEIDSTSTYARSLVLKGEAHGSVVTAAYQSAGRGRLERSWEAPRGLNLLCSYITRPQRPPDEWGGLPLLAGLAVAGCIQECCGLHPRLKWPNDVLLNRAKTAGILVETGIGEHPWAIIGIGVNVLQTEFEGDYRVRPTSLINEGCTLTAADDLLPILSKHLTLWYEEWCAGGNEAVISSWTECSDMIGVHVRLLEEQGSSIAKTIGVNGDGSLRVRGIDGTERDVYAADVSLDLPGDA